MCGNECQLTPVVILFRRSHFGDDIGAVVGENQFARSTSLEFRRGRENVMRDLGPGGVLGADDGGRAVELTEVGQAHDIIRHMDHSKGGGKMVIKKLVVRYRSEKYGDINEKKKESLLLLLR